MKLLNLFYKNIIKIFKSDKAHKPNLLNPNNPFQCYHFDEITGIQCKYSSKFGQYCHPHQQLHFKKLNIK